MAGESSTNDRGGTENKGKHSRSRKSNVCSYVRFYNRTDRHVDIIWLNYEGARVKYKTLSPNQFIDVNTFVGHPWIFKDVESGEKLVVEMKEYFESTTGWTPDAAWPPTRKVVNITIPLYTLKEWCMRLFRRTITEDKIDQLELPRGLKIEMYEKYNTPGLQSSLRSTAKVMHQ